MATDDQSREVEQSFAEMEALLASQNPGIADVMKVYGNADALLRQADRYLAMMEPHSLLTTTNTSG